jgi:predicted acylesterase/phospholipase RssA
LLHRRLRRRRRRGRRPEKLGAWVETLGWQDVVGLMDMGLRGGLIKGDKLIGFFERNFVDRDFTALLHSFGCVATDLQSGHEVWLREGSVSAAVRASIALPGLLTPAWQDGRLLVDGGLVNPVPVSLARAMGADIVIAVDLNSDVVGAAWRHPRVEAPPKPPPAGTQAAVPLRAERGACRRRRQRPSPKACPPCSPSCRAASPSCRCASPAAASPANRPTCSSRRASPSSG